MITSYWNRYVCLSVRMRSALMSSIFVFTNLSQHDRTQVQQYTFSQGDSSISYIISMTIIVLSALVDACQHQIKINSACFLRSIHLKNVFVIWKLHVKRFNRQVARARPRPNKFVGSTLFRYQRVICSMFNHCVYLLITDEAISIIWKRIQVDFFVLLFRHSFACSLFLVHSRWTCRWWPIERI